MRLLPLSKSRSARSQKAPEDHRRSWHVGTSTNHATNGRSSKRGKRRRTWHLSSFPRISRHSVHQHSHVTRHDDPEIANQTKFKADCKVETGAQQERKTFSYAANTAQIKTPPNSTDTTAVTDSPDRPSQGRGSIKKRDVWFRRVKHFLFPGCQPLHSSVHQQHQKQQRVRGGVLMRSCLTAEEHKAKARETVELAKTLYGEDGLRAVGFEYRLAPCPEHSGAQEQASNDKNTTTAQAEEKDGELEEFKSLNKDSVAPPNIDRPQVVCQACASRLFHIESNTEIDSSNRKLFIADGDMYDAVARLCQENAHEVMQRDYGMVWVTLCAPDENEESHPRKRNHHEPIRALVNCEHVAAQNLGNNHLSKEETEYYRQRPTLLIVTGKGKVRAGIFSRQFLMVGSGMQSSTALPLIHEARQRKLNLVLIDPNCHGDSLGMVTFEKSMAKVFQQWEGGLCTDKELNGGCEKIFDDMNATQQKQSCRDLYILSHSASGSHLARYLLEKSQYYLPHIRAIAFTDSTHNVEWARRRGNKQLVDLLESPACVYFRCASADKDSDWSKHHAGQEAPTDMHWVHRFGKIKTCWAGTKEHSLTNWFAHSFIWQHFDKFLSLDDGQAISGIKIAFGLDTIT